MEKTAIIALGGNALSDKSQAGTINDQFSNTRKSLTEIIKFLKEDYNICITPVSYTHLTLPTIAIV